MVPLKAFVKGGECYDKAEIEGGVGHHHASDCDDEEAGRVDESADDCDRFARVTLSESIDEPDCSYRAEKGWKACAKFVRYEGDRGHGEPIAEDWLFEPGDAVQGGGEPVATAEHIHSDGTVETFIKIGQSISPKTEVGEDAEEIPVSAEKVLHC